MNDIVIRQCPWCAEFQVCERPWKFVTETHGDSMTVRATRNAWELAMVEHWRDAHPEQLLAWAEPLLAEAGTDIQMATDAVVTSIKKGFTTRHG